MNKKAGICAIPIAFLALIGLGTRAHAVGATLPFTSYEAESGTLGGGATVVALTGPPPTQFSSAQLEASGHAFVQLNQPGQSVTWTNNTAQNISFINVRYSIPDSTSGGGITSTLDLYVNGQFRQALLMNSRQTWQYEGDNNYAGAATQNPADGDPVNFWDDTHAFITGSPVPPGGTITLQEDSANSAGFYDIDVVDLENPPAPLPQPANSLSITSYGAVADNTPTNGNADSAATDSTTAIQNCINAAQSQGKSVWIPQGTYYVIGTNGLVANGVTIEGAGMWYSKIYRDLPYPNTTPLGALWQVTGCHLSNFANDTNSMSRNEVDGGGGGMDTSGNNWTANDLWNEHVESGIWASGNGGTLSNCRMLSIFADGANMNTVSLSGGGGTGITEFNNFVRGTGDDGIAINSTTEMTNTHFYDNTVIAPWGGKCIAVYGGVNSLVEDNYGSDNNRYIGLGVMIFGAGGTALESATVRNNVIVRGGGNGYSQAQPAMMCGNGGDGGNDGTVENAVISNNTIVNAVYDGMDFSSATNITYENNTIVSPWRNGIELGNGGAYEASSGSATITGNNVVGLAAGMQPYVNNSSGMTASVTGNNWQLSAVPAPAMSLTAASSNYQVGLSWTMGVGASSYNVYRGTTAGGESSSPIANVPEPYYTDTSVAVGTTYYYKVAAVNSFGTSSQSNESSSAATSISTTLPITPFGASATAIQAVSGEVQISWAGSAGATSYNVYAGTSSGGESSTPIATGIDNTFFVATGLTGASTYYFKVAAVNSAGTTGLSNETSAQPAGATSEAPYGGTPWPIPGNLFADDYDTGGSGVAYNVTSTNGNDNGWRTTGDGIDLEANSDTVSNGADMGWTSNGQWFRYTVNVASAGTYAITCRVASGNAAGSAAGSFHIQNAAGNNLSGEINVLGTGSWSTWTNVTATITLPAGQQVLEVFQDTGGYNINYITFAGPPPAPTGLSATGGNAQVALTWTGSTGATSYNVYRGTSSGGESSTPIASGLTGASYTDTSVTNGTTYYYTVAAVDSGGTSGMSNEASATPQAPATEAPFGGTPWPIPGTVQAENYDTGGQGIAYNVTSINGNGTAYRSDGVDIETTSDTGGGYDLGWTSNGQWFRYTVNVSTAGTYTVTFRVASDAAVGTTGGTLHLQNSAGTNLTGSVSVPGTGGWQTWTNVTANVTLPAGQQVLEYFQDTGGYNLNYMTFASASTGPPPAPTGLTATAGNAQVALVWSSASGATSYNVYRGTSAGGESSTALAGSLTGTTYTDTSVTNGTTYYYKVAAVDSGGTSGLSNEASGTPSSGGTTAIDQIDCGSGSAVSPFVADEFFSGGTEFSSTNTINTSGVTNPAPAAVYQTVRWGAMTYTIPNLTAGQSYTVRLHFCELTWTAAGQRLFNVAINGTSYLSNFDIFATAGGQNKALVEQTTATANSSGQIVISFTVGSADNPEIAGIEIDGSGGGGSAPPAPTGLSAAGGNAQASLTWSSSSGATSYNVYRGTTSGGESSTAIATGLTGTSYTNTGLTNGTTYFYKVAAVNSIGTSGQSNEASATPSAGAPPAPTGLTATGGNATVSLTWSSSSGATSYSVYRGTSSGGEGSTAIGTSTGTSYSDTTVTNGTTYYYTVKAVSSGGTSAASNEAHATPSAGLTAVDQIDCGSSTAVSPFVADEFFSAGNEFSSTATINTSGVTNAAPAAVYQTVRWNSSFNYTIPNLTAGSTYTVRLHFCELTWTAAGQRVFNVAINGNSYLSNFDIFATAGAQNKAVVEQTTATANSSGQIVISFTQGSADNPEIAGIEILH